MDELTASFHRAVDSLVLESERSRVSDLQSTRNPNTRVWTLRDANGEVVAEVGGNPQSIAKDIAPTKPALPAKRYVTMSSLEAVVKATAKRIKKSDEGLLDVAKALVARIEALEAQTVNKSLDAEAYDAMAEIAERIEQIESKVQEVSDNGFRYRGYWKQGKFANRGDSFTWDGSMWWAIRDTSEAPSRESHAWQIAVRKGRDAR